MTATLDTATAAVLTTGPQLRQITKWVNGVKGHPAEGAVRVTVAGGELIAVVTDFETIRIADVELDVSGEPGTATAIIPCAALKAAAEAMPGRGSAPVEVAVTDGICVDVTAEPGTVRANRVGIEWDCGRGWPDLPPTPGLAATLDEAGLAAIGRVAVAASAEPELPWLGSVRMQGTGGVLWLTATDRYKIGAEQVPCDCTGDWMFPAREAAAWVKTAGGPGYLLADGPLVGLTDGTWTVITRRVTGDPVDIRTYMPAQELRHPFTATLTCDAAQLAAALGPAAKIKGSVKAGTTIPQKTFVDAVAVTGEPLAMTLQRGVEEWAGTCEAGFEGDKLVAGLNPAYLAATLAHLSGPVEIRLAAGDDGRVLNPAKITCQALPGWTGWQAMIDPSK